MISKHLLAWPGQYYNVVMPEDSRSQSVVNMYYPYDPKEAIGQTRRDNIRFEPMWNVCSLASAKHLQLCPEG